jgi:hypothetical protein
LAFTIHVLVVANRTVDAPELMGALRERAARGPIRATLLVPCAWSERPEAQARLGAAVRMLGDAGIPAEGLLGDADPIVAVQEAWSPARYDEVVVSTLAEGASQWLRVDLPHRVAKLTDCQVRHVAVPLRRPPEPVAARAPERKGVLEGLLSLLRSATRGRAASR